MAEVTMKSLVGKRLKRSYKFMDASVEITKLSVSQVLEIQDMAGNASSDGKAGFELVKKVIRMAVPEANELSDEDFVSFPMDELSKLSNEIMKFSGLGAEAGK